MSYQPQNVPFTDPSLPIYDALARSVGLYPDDPEIAQIKATLDANPSGLPFHTLVGLYCITAARVATLSAAVVGDDFSIERDAAIGRDAVATRDVRAGRDLAVTRNGTVGGTFGVTGQTTLSGALFGPGVSSGTYVAGRPSLFKNPTTGEIYTALTDYDLALNLSPRYLAIRTDGRPGTGTENDPYDVSTASKLDTLWPTLPTGIPIIFGKGTFVTATGLSLLSGQQIIGAGRNLTTIQLANATMSGANQRKDIIASAVDSAGNSVMDLTIDGNRDSQSSFTGAATNCQLYAINLLGARCEIRRVRVRGTWNSGSGECFPVIIASGKGTYLAPAIGQIEDVEVSDHRGYSTLLNLLGVSDVDGSAIGRAVTGLDSDDKILLTAHGYNNGDTVYLQSKTGGSNLQTLRRYFVVNKATDDFQLAITPGGSAVNFGSDLTAPTKLFRQTWITGYVRNCVVNGRTDTYASEQGIGCGGWLGVSIDGNRLDGVAAGIHTDTHCFEKVSVKQNFMRLNLDPGGGSGQGIFAGGGFRWADWVIEGNVFLQCGNSIGVRLGSSVGNCDNFLITGNTFLWDGVTTSPTLQGINFSAAPTSNTNVRVVNNAFDPNMTHATVPWLGAELTFATGNRNSDGTDTVIADSLKTYVVLATGDGGAAQSITGATRAAVTLATEVRDDLAMFTSGTDIETPGAGVIEIEFQVALASVGGTGQMVVEVLKNGSSTALKNTKITSGATGRSYNLSVQDECAEGDIYQLSFYNNSGGTSSISKDAQDTNLQVRFRPSAT